MPFTQCRITLLKTSTHRISTASKRRSISRKVRNTIAVFFHFVVGCTKQKGVPPSCNWRPTQQFRRFPFFSPIHASALSVFLKFFLDGARDDCLNNQQATHLKMMTQIHVCLCIHTVHTMRHHSRDLWTVNQQRLTQHYEELAFIRFTFRDRRQQTTRGTIESYGWSFGCSRIVRKSTKDTVKKHINISGSTRISFWSTGFWKLLKTYTFDEQPRINKHRALMRKRYIYYCDVLCKVSLVEWTLLFQNTSVSRLACKAHNLNVED